MLWLFPDRCPLELQVQYSTFKSNLQQIAQKIGDVEQESEEHKYALLIFRDLGVLPLIGVFGSSLPLFRPV